MRADYGRDLEDGVLRTADDLLLLKLLFVAKPTELVMSILARALLVAAVAFDARVFDII